MNEFFEQSEVESQMRSGASFELDELEPMQDTCVHLEMYKEYCAELLVAERETEIKTFSEFREEMNK